MYHSFRVITGYCLSKKSGKGRAVELGGMVVLYHAQFNHSASLVI